MTTSSEADGSEAAQQCNLDSVRKAKAKNCPGDPARSSKKKPSPSRLSARFTDLCKCTLDLDPTVAKSTEASEGSKASLVGKSALVAK